MLDQIQLVTHISNYIIPALPTSSKLYINMSSINREKFTLGISLLFKTQWTALKLAVDMQWGGHDSEDKRDWLIDVIVNYFDKSNVFNFNFQ